MKTFSDYLSVYSQNLREDIKNLLLCHSSLEYCNPHSEYVTILDVNGNFHWKELPLEGKRLQGKILDQYGRYESILRHIITANQQDSLHKSQSVIKKVIEQRTSTWNRTPQEAFDTVADAFYQIEHLLEAVHSSETNCMAVPDTNALLINPAIETWAFPDVKTFALVLTPTVLRELDEHKINHRNEAVREKAKTLIRRIKEYRRRGDISVGVPVIGKKITLMSVAVEPDFQRSLPWLDPSNGDDRLIASVYEVVRSNIRSAVFLVTSDINVQNKAEYACLPFTEPPEPV